MKLKTIFILLFTGIFIAACNDKQSESAKGDYSFNKIQALANEPAGLVEENGSDFQPKKSRDSKSKSIQTDQKIIRTGLMTVESKNVLKSKSSLDATVKKLGGYYEQDESENNHRVIDYNLAIRVPASNFDKLVNSIEKGGDKVSNKSISADNVTEEYFDLKTRLENKRAYLKRYQELLNRANSIEEVLKIEGTIRPLEEEIESREGRIRFLNDQVGFSTLHINLFQKLAYYDKPNEDTFTDRVMRALGNGWSAIGHLTIGLLTMWPFLILIGLAIFFVRRYSRRKKGKQA